MTSLIRTRNTSSMRNLQREIDRLFDNFFPARSGEDNGSGSEAVWAPRVDLAEDEENYLIHVDLPGMRREDLKINYQDNQLTISGERRDEQEQDTGDYVRVERSFGHFYRSFTLPKSIDAEDISAEYDNGVLHITVPKAEANKPRQIEIS